MNNPQLKKAILIVVPFVLLNGFILLGALIFFNSKTVWNPFPVNLVLTDACATEFFQKFNFLHVPCLKHVVSKGIGYAIVFASGALKFPMIFNVWKAQTTSGLSISSVGLESIAYACFMASSLSKSLPFSLWGESSLIFIQNILLLLLAVYFSPTYGLKRTNSLVVVGVLCVSIGALMAPVDFANVLLMASTLISVSSRIPQMASNFVNKHTGILSLATQSLLVFGSLVRLVTVFVETSDGGARLGIVISCVLNACLLGQIIVYWDKSREFLAKKTEKKVD